MGLGWVGLAHVMHDDNPRKTLCGEERPDGRKPIDNDTPVCPGCVRVLIRLAAYNPNTYGLIGGTPPRLNAAIAS